MALRNRHGFGRERSVLSDLWDRERERERNSNKPVRRMPARDRSAIFRSNSIDPYTVPRRERSTPPLSPSPARARARASAAPPIRVQSQSKSTSRYSNSPPVPISSRSGVFLYVQVRIHDVVQKLLVPRMLTQVPVGDRTFLLRKYRRCFTGSDAVAWFMARRFARDVAEAVSLGQAMQRAGVFRHVRNEHPFRNGHYFYRFAAHEEYAVEDDNYSGLRSSRLMTMATRPYSTSRYTSSSDESAFGSCLGLDEDCTASSTTSSTSSSSASPRPFHERHVAVDVGIRVGPRLFPDLVSRFTTKEKIASVNVRNGKKIRDSFSGSHAAFWFKHQKYVRDDREAVAVGNALIKAGVFFPIDDNVNGFEDNDDALYRLTMDVDLRADMRRGERKDAILRLLGINRSRNADPAGTNAPWFDDSLSFTSDLGN